MTNFIPLVDNVDAGNATTFNDKLGTPLSNAIGNLTTLTTTDKDSAVDAINEVRAALLTVDSEQETALNSAIVTLSNSISVVSANAGDAIDLAEALEITVTAQAARIEELETLNEQAKLIEGDWKFLHTFTTDAAAPISGTIIGDIGSWTVVDTLGTSAIVDGQLVFGVSNAVNDPGIWSATAYSRVPGRAILCRVTLPSAGTRRAFGWANASGTAVRSGLWLNDLELRALDNVSQVLAIGTLTYNTTYEILLIQRASGFFAFMRQPNDLKYKLVYVGVTEQTVNNYPAFSTRAMPALTTGQKIDNLYSLDFGVPFDTEFGLATSHLVNPVVNSVVMMEADAWIDVVFVYDGTAMRVQYRRVSATSAMEVRAEGGAVALYSVSGTATLIESIAGVFTNGNTYRLRILAYGNNHKIMVGNTVHINQNNTLNQTSTGV